MSASAPVRSARLVLERDLVAPLLSPWLLPRDLLRLSTTSRSCLQVVRAGMETLDLVEYSHDDGGNCRTPHEGLTDAHVSAIVRYFPSLRSLTLGTNKHVTDISMGAIATLSRLRVLDISGCNITVAGMSALPEKLESLVLGDCTIYAKDGEVFRNVLSDEKLSAAVRRCPCLQTLDLSGASAITENGLLAVADACPDLKSLDLAFLRRVTDNAIIHLSRSCTRLVKLNIGSLPYTPVEVTDAAILALADNCPVLEELRLGPATDKLTDASIIALAQKCTALKKLSLSESLEKADRFTDASLQALARSCRSLKHLGLGRCCGFTDAGMVPIASSCGNLLALTLVGCPLTDDSVLAIATGCPTLESLSLGPEFIWSNPDERFRAADFHDSSIVALATGCTRLQGLTLIARHVTDTAVLALAHNCRDLRSVSLTCGMTDVGLVALAQCPLLQTIALETPEITDDGVVSLSNIDHLSLTKCNRVGPAAICRVVQCSPMLQWVSFYSCAHVSDDIVFFYLYENVENIIHNRKNLMRNLVEFMDEPKRVPTEVRDELGVQVPDSESESDSDSSDSGDY